MGYSHGVSKESDTTKRLTHAHTHTIKLTLMRTSLAV